MRDIDRAWEYGSYEIEAEANRDAIPGPGEYVCSGCERVFDFDEHPPVEEDEYRQELWGIEHGTRYICPECAGIENEGTHGT